MSLKLCKLNTQRLLALLLAAVLVVSQAPAASAAESGSCGDSLTWTLNAGTLAISGSGAMTDYSEDNMPPWYDLREQIRQVSLPEELTHIGNTAFYDCGNLGSVTIPGSVTSIGELAFSGCESMTMVTMNNGLQTIGDNAFEKCASLLDLRLPETVTSIGHHAFYFCTSLSTVSIPGYVTSFGSGIFSYCHNLVRADIAVPADALPSWTFYGCDKLSTVNTQDGSVSASTMKIPNTPGASTPQVPTEPEISTQITSGSTTTTTQTSTNDTGATTTNTTVVQKTESSTTVSNTTSTKNPVPGSDSTSTEVTTEITATVVDPEGWNDVIQQVENAQKNPQIQDGTDSVNVTVYLPQDNTVSKDVIQELAGKDVTLNVQTQSGSQFTLDCKQLEQQKINRDLDLSYSLEIAEDVPEMLAGCTVYKLSFHNSASILAEIIIRLPGGHNRQTASLYQTEKDGLNLLQSVMVDDNSNTHWYLKSVDHEMEYLIAINVPSASASEAIIPEVLYDEYKLANVYDGVEYVVTGRTSSWGVGLGQVMGILAGVMIGVIVLVGVIMFLWNKQRLKNGYVPQWDDEE